MTPSLAELAAFLAAVVVISLSGVMMPGPVFAVTMAHGQHRPLAGAAISLGHAAVELPLVILIWLGFGRLFHTPLWKAAVGLGGGVVLVLIGVDMYRQRNVLSAARAGRTSGALGAGLLTTLASPYFFIWWATVGAALVTRAAAWGAAGLAAFFVVHWSCDLAWNLVVSGASWRAGRVWSAAVHRAVFAAGGVLLAGFGLWFITGALFP